MALNVKTKELVAVGAISYIEDEEELLGGKIVFDYNLCKSCGTCAEVCWGSAIEMK